MELGYFGCWEVNTEWKYFLSMLHGAYVLRTIAQNAIAASSVWHSLNTKTELNCHDSTDVMQWTVAAIWRRVTILGARVGRNPDGAWQDLWPEEQTSAANRVQPRCICKSEHMSSCFTSTPEQSCVGGRITRQECVKTPVNTTRRMWNRPEEFTDRSHRTERDHRDYLCRRKKMWSTYSRLHKATSHEQKTNILPGRGQWWGQPSLPLLWQKKCVDCCQTRRDAVVGWHSSSWLKFKGRN